MYWKDEPEVREGSILAFFSDNNDPAWTELSICYMQFQRTRLMAWNWYGSEKHTPLISPGWWQSVLTLFDIDLEYF